MTSLPAPALLGTFAACAAVIWIVGIKLSDMTDVLSQRWHLGSALGGVILLAIATNLPEISITASASLAHQLDVAVGNILGGIAIQTVVLVALDAAGVRPRQPLTYLAASLTLVLEGALMVALLVVVVMSTQLPRSLILWRLTPGGVLIVILWAVGLLLVRRADRGESIEVDTVNLRMVARTLPGKQFEAGRQLRALVVSALLQAGVETDGKTPTVAGTSTVDGDGWITVGGAQRCPAATRRPIRLACNDIRFNSLNYVARSQASSFRRFQHLSRSSWVASHGRVAAKAWAANFQVCSPGRTSMSLAMPAWRAAAES